MKKTAKKNRAKRVIASVLAGVMMLSTASALTVTLDLAGHNIINSGNIDPNSRIGITSNTSDGDLDVVKIWNKSAYNNTANVFSYDTSKYRINRYTHWYSDFYWVEIVKR